MIKYKRKFLVLGDSIPRCRDYEKQCRKRYGFDNIKRPCTVNVRERGSSTYWDRNMALCPFPINKPRKYIVVETEDGEWQCSCPVWKFRRQECKHIRKVQANPEKYEISPDFTGKTVEIMDKLLGR